MCIRDSPKISWLQRADDGVQCDAEKYSQPKCLNLRSRGLLGRFGHLLKSFSSLCMLKLAFSPKRFIFRASGSYIWEGEGPNSGLRGWLVIKEEREGS